MYKLVVYSCIAGRFDPLEHILGSALTNSPDVKYILFAESGDWGKIDASQADKWEVRPLAWTHVNPRRTSRFHKVNAHFVLPPHDMSCWIDGSLQIKPGVDLLEVGAKILSENCTEIAAFKHPERRCIYEEHQACLRFKKDDPDTMQAQIKRYMAEMYPPLNGLAETACVFRRKTAAVRRFNELWWKEIEQGSLRDQLSFDYVSYSLGVAYAHIPGRRDKSSYFTFRSHKR